MMLLILSSVVPILAPALFLAVAARKGAISFLDGFVVVAVPGLVFLHTLPGAVAGGEWITLGALGLGLIAPILLERVAPRSSWGAHGMAVILGVSGLALHAALEGAAIASLGSDGSTSSLGMAIVLHRLPVGLALWWLVEAELGHRAALASLAGLVGVTVAGYFGGAELTELLSIEGIHLYEAFVGGTLVHVVMHGFHPHGAGKPSQVERVLEGIGGSVAVGLLAALALVGDGSGPTAGGAFLSRFLVLAAESAPALLLAYVAAGLLFGFMPATSIRWMSKGGALSSSARGMVVGLPLPICSCGVVPLYRTLIAKGTPPAAAISFLIATPELGLDAVFLSIPLLGGEMTLYRVGMAAAVALLVGWWVGGRIPAHPPLAEPADGDGAPVTARDKFAAGMRTGLGGVVDDTAPWILAGLGIAALVAPLLEGGLLETLPAYLDVMIFAVVGFPLYVCASSATPLVATLLATGLSPGAAIAFLITGPATNTTTIGVLSGLHGRKAALGFAGAVVLLAVAGGIALNMLVGSVTGPTLESLLEEPPGLLHQVALFLLALLFLSSVLRRGVRSFLAELRSGLGNGGGTASDGCDCDDDEVVPADCC